MSSRRSRRVHVTQPRYSTDEFDAEVDTDSYVNNTASTNTSKHSSRLHDNTKELPESDDNDEAPEEFDELEEITRCVCQSDDLKIPKNGQAEFYNVDPGFFIQCEKCSAWQHGYCVGIKDEENSPEKYWCEKCKPENHTLFTDKFGIRRSKYDPLNTDQNNSNNNNNNNNTQKMKRGLKRKNGRFISNKSDDAEESADAVGDLNSDGNIDTTNNTVNNKPTDGGGEGEGEGEISNGLLGGEHKGEAGERKRKEGTEGGGQEEEEEEEEEEEDDDGEDNDGEKSRKKQRKRSSYSYRDYNYEEMLKKALEESAKESGVAPEEVNLSASEGNSVIRETRTASLRKTRTKYDDDSDSAVEDENSNTNNSSQPSNLNQNLQSQANSSHLSGNETIKSEKQVETRVKTEDKRRARDSKRTRPKRKTPVTSASNDEQIESSNTNKDNSRFVSFNANNNLNSNSHLKRFNKKEKKDLKQAAPDDKPFRANIPSARISMNEMTRRIFSIMDFVSNIQINLSNEEDFKNKLFNMNDEGLSPEILKLKDNLIGCYNDSIKQLDGLTGLLNEWQTDHT